MSTCILRLEFMWFTFQMSVGCPLWGVLSMCPQYSVATLAGGDSCRAGTHNLTGCWPHTGVYCTTLHPTAPHYTTLHHTAPHCSTLHHTAPQCTPLHHKCLYFYWGANDPNSLQLLWYWWPNDRMCSVCCRETHSQLPSTKPCVPLEEWRLVRVLELQLGQWMFGHVVEES